MRWISVHERLPQPIVNNVYKTVPVFSPVYGLHFGIPTNEGYWQLATETSGGATLGNQCVTHWLEILPTDYPDGRKNEVHK